MGSNKRRLAKLFSIPVLALAGFLVAASIAGVGGATGTTVGQEGCTPGYWKQDQHFDSWPVSTSTTLAQAGFLNTGNQSSTLLQALSFQGGPTVQDAKNILMRAASAAYLNSFDLSYPLSTAGVVAAVNTALASGNRTTILALATVLDGYNNGGCPLN